MSKKIEQKYIEVHAHWAGLSEPALVGVLHARLSRGKEIFSFNYDLAWLKHSQSYILDPALQLVQGTQYPLHEQENFGVFLDTSPDRWGRVLMNKREAQLDGISISS